MRKALASSGLVLALAAVLAIGGFTGDPSQVKASSVGKFVSLTASGVNVDYTPLASPKDAVAKADLVVEGRLTDVVDGIGLTFPDPRYTERKANSFATLVLTVERVISGDPEKVRDGRVYVAVQKSRVAQISQLASANPQPQTIAVLDDITTWTPSPDVRVTRPAAVPTGAPLYAPFTDGLWLQGPGDAQMTGLHAHPDELTAAWNHPRTVREFSAALQQAAP